MATQALTEGLLVAKAARFATVFFQQAQTLQSGEDVHACAAGAAWADSTYSTAAEGLNVDLSSADHVPTRNLV